MTVAFAVIFMALIEKKVQTSPQKPVLWKRHIDDIFYARTIPETEINNFIDFANSFRATFRFMNEQSSKKNCFSRY